MLNSPFGETFNFFPSGLHAETFQENHYKLILFSIDVFFYRCRKARASIGSDSSFNSTESFPKHFICILPIQLIDFFRLFRNHIFYWIYIRIVIFIIYLFRLLKRSKLRSEVFCLNNFSELVIFHGICTESCHILSSGETVHIRKSVGIGKWRVYSFGLKSCNCVHLVKINNDIVIEFVNITG